jgi:predicted metal-dependent hydrolase
MLKSVRETQKLFSIEGIQDGEVNIETSEYLLSLPKDKQTEVLRKHLEYLKEDLAKYEDPIVQDPNGKDDDIDKAQLQILIDVIEGLLSQI